jgi:hypothetical protein
VTVVLNAALGSPVYTYICMYICMYMCMYIWEGKVFPDHNLGPGEYSGERAPLQVRMCLHAYMCTCIYIYCVYIYIYIHIYIYTYI